eukprot:403365344
MQNNWYLQPSQQAYNNFLQLSQQPFQSQFSLNYSNQLPLQLLNPTFINSPAQYSTLSALQQNNQNTQNLTNYQQTYQGSLNTQIQNIQMNPFNSNMNNSPTKVAYMQNTMPQPYQSFQQSYGNIQGPPPMQMTSSNALQQRMQQISQTDMILFNQLQNHNIQSAALQQQQQQRFPPQPSQTNKQVQSLAQQKQNIGQQANLNNNQATKNIAQVRHPNQYPQNQSIVNESSKSTTSQSKPSSSEQVRNQTLATPINFDNVGYQNMSNSTISSANAISNQRHAPSTSQVQLQNRSGSIAGAGQLTGQNFVPNSTIQASRTRRPLNHELQSKAYTCYKKIFKQNGKIDPTQVFGFFYMNTTKRGQEGEHLIQIETLRKRLIQFGARFANFQPVQTNSNQIPKILVVCEEIFEMNDTNLSQQCKLSLPNQMRDLDIQQVMRTQELEGNDSTVKTGHKNSQNPRGLPKSIQQRNDELDNAIDKLRYQNSNSNSNQQRNKIQTYIVQSYIFDGNQEHEEATIHSYLHQYKHDIITFKMCTKILEYWMCQLVEWHVERGLKIKSDGVSTGPNERGLTIQQIQTMSQQARKNAVTEAKKCHFALTCKVQGLATAAQISAGGISRESVFAHEAHMFNINTQAVQNTLKSYFKSQSNVYIGKYDLPQYMPNSPLGTSVFPFASERQQAQQNYEQYMDKHNKDMQKLNKKLTPREKRPKSIEEPKPGNTHTYCNICRDSFQNYIEHIGCQKHRTSVRTGTNSQLYSDIDKVILDVQKLQEENLFKESEFYKAKRLLGQNSKKLLSKRKHQKSNNPEEQHFYSDEEGVVVVDESSDETAKNKNQKRKTTGRGDNQNGENHKSTKKRDLKNLDKQKQEE